MDTKNIAKKIRKNLKKEFNDNAKFSVRSNPGSISINIKELSKDCFKSLDEFEDEHLTERLTNPPLYDYLKNQFLGNQINSVKDEVYDRIKEIANEDNWDKSDIYSDYVNVNYFLTISCDCLEGIKII